MCRLIPTTEYEEYDRATLGIVDPVTRAVVNPELPDPTAYRVGIPEIAETHTSKTSTDTSTGLSITQPQ